jgi:two-component system phosphate regulon response regulator PhoB
MSKGTVLVVDDDPFLIDFLETALESEGYRVLASVGGHAVQVARALHPDLILLDIGMPGMDGIEVSRYLRDDVNTADIPIVLMSEFDRSRPTAALLPVNDRLPKPFLVSDLYSVVSRWVKDP